MKANPWYLNFIGKVRNKLTLLFYLIAVTPFILFAWIIDEHYVKTIKDNAFDKLIAIRQSKKEQVEGYFYKTRSNVRFLSQSHSIVEAARHFTKAFHSSVETTSEDKEMIALGLKSYYEEEFFEVVESSYGDEYDKKLFFPRDTKTQFMQYSFFVNSKYDETHDYFKVHEKHHAGIKRILEEHNYYDIFLVDTLGYITYSTIKETDFATNLFSDLYRNGALASVASKALSDTNSGAVYFQDFNFYPPSFFRPVSFIASPIFDENEHLGALIFQLPIEEIDEIMTSLNLGAENKLDKSGESYLVGNDYRMRSNSRFIISDSVNFKQNSIDRGLDNRLIEKMDFHNSTILFLEIKTASVDSALMGKTGTTITKDYRHIPVLSAYTPLNIPEVNWILLSEIDQKEAFEGVSLFRRWLLVIVVFGIAVILLAGFMVAGYFSKPIKKLVVAMKEVGYGNLGIKVNLGQQDEIQVLTLAFNNMVDRIREILDELKEKNEKLSLSREGLLTQKKYIEEKNNELQHLIQTKNRLFSIIGHDLRGPFNSLESILNLLKGNMISQKEFKSFSTKLSGNLDHASRLLNNLLKWSRSQLDGFEYSIKALDLSEIIGQEIVLLSQLASDKGISIEFKNKQVITNIRTDKDMISLVIRNLIANAVKYTNKGGIVTISMVDNLDKTIVSIKDTGIGMDKSKLTRLFSGEDPSAPGTNNEQGTGLGLILCKDFIEKLGGEITAESEKGKGSLFYFSLPKVKN